MCIYIYIYIYAVDSSRAADGHCSVGTTCIDAVCRPFRLATVVAPPCRPAGRCPTKASRNNGAKWDTHITKPHNLPCRTPKPPTTKPILKTHIPKHSVMISNYPMQTKR